MARERAVQFTAGEAAFITALPQAEVQKAVDEGWFASAPRHVVQGLSRRCFGPADLVHLRLVKDLGGHAILHTEAKWSVHRALRARVPDLRWRSDNLVILVKENRGRITPNRVRDATLLLHRGTLETKMSSGSGAAHPDQDQVAVLRDWARHVAERLEEPVTLPPLKVDAAPVWDEIVHRTLATIEAQWAVVSDPEIRSGEPVVRGTRIPVYLLQDLKRQGATDEELLADYPSLDERSLASALLYADTHPRRGRPRKGPWHAPAAQ